MKRYITYIIIFFCAVFVVDRAVGLACDYLYSHAKGGDSKHTYDVFNNVTADVIILGSSRALHHYVPSIIEDSTGFSCYNCACDNQGIINMYGRYKMIAKRKKPKYVICEILPSLDIYKDVDDIKYLNSFKPFRDNSELAEIIKDYSPIELFKTNSYVYRYNTFIFQILKDYVQSGRLYADKGFSPCKGRMNYNPEPYKETIGEVDSLKVKYIYKLVETTKRDNVRLFFAASPRYSAHEDFSLTIIKEICKKEQIPFISFYTDTSLNTNKTLFKDRAHLNETGAFEYTKKFVKRLKLFLESYY